MNRSRAVAIAILACACLLRPPPSPASPGDTALISTKRSLVASYAASTTPRISANGRYIVFESDAADLVEKDINGHRDIFLRDSWTAVTKIVSVNASGELANGDSRYPSVSADGRYIAFSSTATNLNPCDTDSEPDIYVHDRLSGFTELVSVTSAGQKASRGSSETAISADGRFVAFISYAFNLYPHGLDGLPNVFVRDRQLGSTQIASLDSNGLPGNWRIMRSPSISADGRHVAFAIENTSIHLPDQDEVDVFVRDLQAGTTEIIDVDPAGNNFATAYLPSISDDGRYVAFDAGQIYVRDRETKTSILVSSDATGAAGNRNSRAAAISSTGRYVTFVSAASNLVAGDTNGFEDIFLKDRQTGSVVRVNVGPNGEQQTQSGDGNPTTATTSSDGRYVAFATEDSNIVSGDGNNLADIFLRDLQLSATTLASPAIEASRAAGAVGSRITPDGRYVVFSSSAALVADDTNHQSDVFVLDRETGGIERVSLNSSGEQAQGPSADSYAASISKDGRFVAFESFARDLVADDTNTLVDIFLRDRQTGTTRRINLGIGGAQANGSCTGPRISLDGRYIAYRSSATNLVQNDTNASDDIFVFDRQTGITERVSVGAGGMQANSPSSTYQSEFGISGDGRYVAFGSDADNLVGDDTNHTSDVFVRDRATGQTQRVSVGTNGAQADQISLDIAISADGRYVAFVSQATTLVPGDTNRVTDVFVHDRTSHVTERVSTGPAGLQANDASSSIDIDPEGRFVTFASLASNLVADDSNAGEDLFVHDRNAGRTRRVSIASNGAQSNDIAVYRLPALSADGRFVTFTSSASDLVPGDLNEGMDTFLHELPVDELPMVRINAGGGSFIDSNGHLWASDSGFNTGSALISSSPIAGTADDYLYRSLRWDDTSGPELEYSVALPNGSYLVRLHFAETSNNAAYVGARTFDVDIEGERRFDNVDVFAEAGGTNTALVKDTKVTVADGRLNISFRHQAKNPIVSAIEIVGLTSSGGIGASIRTNAGGGQYIDSQGKAWSADAGFNTGSVSISTAPIAGTTDDSLFQSLRWDDTPVPELQYSYPVANGVYDVALYFVESNPKTAYPGGRVFDVDIEGVERFGNVDVFAQSGGLNRALVKNASVTVTDGQINILLRRRIRNPIISAIEIVGR